MADSCVNSMTLLPYPSRDTVTGDVAFLSLAVARMADRFAGVDYGVWLVANG
jgi:hypothetical protein